MNAKKKYRIKKEESRRITNWPTLPEEVLPKAEAKEKLAKNIDKIDELQEKLYAEGKQSLLLVFQAMDAGGKDSTIRKVLSGVNPAGVGVFSFKKPTDEELNHDFLWRLNAHLPAKGMIHVFNRSHYEEVLIAKVIPQIIVGQKLTGISRLDDITPEFWSERYDQIREWEKRLASSNTRVIKFFLNVSKETQKERLLARLDVPEKRWKFSIDDLKQRKHWETYQDAYESAIVETSRQEAPWYAIPADDKPNMRYIVSEIVKETLQDMDPQFPPFTSSIETLRKEADSLFANEK